MQDDRSPRILSLIVFNASRLDPAKYFGSELLPDHLTRIRPRNPQSVHLSLLIGAWLWGSVSAWGLLGVTAGGGRRGGRGLFGRSGRAISLTCRRLAGDRRCLR